MNIHDELKKAHEILHGVGHEFNKQHTKYGKFANKFNQMILRLEVLMQELQEPQPAHCCADCCTAKTDNDDDKSFFTKLVDRHSATSHNYEHFKKDNYMAPRWLNDMSPAIMLMILEKVEVGLAKIDTIKSRMDEDREQAARFGKRHMSI